MVDAFGTRDRVQPAGLWVRPSASMPAKGEVILNWLAHPGEALRRVVVVLDQRPDRSVVAWAFQPLLSYDEIPNNLLAVEVRKASNHQPPEHDQQKLRALTDPHLWFAYGIGVYLVLGKRIAASEIYVAGALDQSMSRWFSQRLKEAGLVAE